MNISSKSSVNLDILSRVFKFNHIIKADQSKVPGALASNTKNWLIKALEEELQEFREAETPEDSVDALIDLVIFACGGLYRSRLTLEQAKDSFLAVLDANDAKKSGVKENRAVEGVADAIKPLGWVDPKTVIANILNGVL